MGLPHTEPERFPAMTPDEKSFVRHEYLNGYVQAMPRGTHNHSALKMNLYRELGTRLLGKRCRPYGSDFRVSAPSKSGYFYPDASIFCGAVEADAQDKNTGANRLVIFEVLSDSSEAYDRGFKFASYRVCDSLLYYALISQKIPRADLYEGIEFPPDADSPLFHIKEDSAAYSVP